MKSVIATYLAARFHELLVRLCEQGQSSTKPNWVDSNIKSPGNAHVQSSLRILSPAVGYFSHPDDISFTH